MRIIASLIICIVAPLVMIAQSFTVGGVESDAVSAIATDSAGNIYVAYSFTGSIDLDPGPGELMVVSERDELNRSTRDVAIASYTSRGGLRWGFSYGSPRLDEVSSIAVAGGRVVLAGSINGPVYDIDPSEILVSISAPLDKTLALLLSYDTAGAYHWVRVFGDETSNIGARAHDVYLRPDGTAISTGYFHGSFDPDGPGTGIGPWVSKNQSTDVWVGCWSSDGTMFWGESFGGVGNDEGRAIVGTADTFYVAGVFEQVIDLDPTNAALEQTSIGGYDTFLGCFTDSVRVQWGTRWGGKKLGTLADQIMPKCLTRRSDGSLFAAYVALDTCTFGNDNRPPILVSRGLEDIAVVSMDALGVHQWSFTIGGAKPGELPYALSLTDDNNILVAGMFWGTADLDPSSAVATFRAASDSAGAAFVAQFSRDGNYQWAYAVSAPNTNAMRSQNASFNTIAIDRAISDEIILGGGFGGTATLGTAPGFGTVRATSEGMDDAMVLRLDQTGAVLFDALTSVEADDDTREACDIRTTTHGVEIAMRSGGAFHVALYDIMGRRLASSAADSGHVVLPLETNEPCIVVVESGHQRYTARILRY